MPRQTTTQSDWVPRTQLDLMMLRCGEAEECCKQLLHLINPNLLAEHAGDYLEATRALMEDQ